VRTLLRGGRVHVEGAAPGVGPTALAVDDGRIAWIGDEDGAEAWSGGDVVDLAGAWLAPAFTDSHVHAVQAGFAVTQLDLTGSPSLAAMLDAVHRYAGGQAAGAVVIGQGWDESVWPEGRTPTGGELERAAPGMRVCLTRVDGHSSVVSPAMAASVPGLEAQDGWSPDGRVERDAEHAVRVVLAGLVGPEQRLAAARATCRQLVAAGVVGFHENAAPHIGPEYEIDLVRRAAEEAGVHATVYWGEAGALDAARRLRVAGLAGDLNVDGAVGSRTAAVHEPYSDDPGTRGHVFLDAEAVADHVVLCTEAGLQAGFHCIGDAAMDAVAEGFLRAAEKLGEERVAAARHRLEHAEMPSHAVVAALARLRVTASVQPFFDTLWGGPSQMYAERLGDRWRGMNPLRSLSGAGVPLAFGSDCPVTPVGPWAAVRAAVHHREEPQRLDPATAFDAHTRGGWAACRDDHSGRLLVGLRADLAAWDTPHGLGPEGVPVLEPGADLPTPVRTLAAGRTVWNREETR
jgi:predicted amidohydrolase YtcJ